MAKAVNITLTTLGTSMGTNFSLFSNHDGYVSAFETGVSKSSLASGYVSNLVPNDTTTIRVKSTDGLCINTSVDLPISGLPAVTPTPTVTTTQQVILTTPTPTPTPLPTLNLNLIVISSGSDGATACTNNANSQYTFDVYSEFHQLTDGDTLYLDALGSEVFVGTGGFYSDGSTFGKINSSGLYTLLDNCPS